MNTRKPEARDVRSTDDLLAEVEWLADELRKSETRFRDVIEGNADAIVVVGDDGMIRFANKVAADLFGKPVKNLVGHPFGFPAIAGATTELDLLRDGSTVVVEMRVVDSEWEGQDACIATLRDATDRKHAEETARRLIAEQAARGAADQATRRFRFLADASSALAASLDYRAMMALLPRICASEISDWAIVFRVENGLLEIGDGAHRNPQYASLLQELRQYPSATASLAPIVEAVASREAILVTAVTSKWLDDHILEPAQRALIGKLGVESLMLVPLVARDNLLGAVVLASANPARLYTQDDLALAEDLASRAALALDNARLYTDAKEANRTKTDFLAVISHDLRTPLNAILGYSDLLLLGIPEPLKEVTLESVRRIRTSASHLVYLIDELLGYARLESGHEVLKFTHVAIQQIAEEVSAVIQPLANERGLEFTIEMPAQSSIVDTDPDKLRQVLLNVVSNAVKYTQHGFVRMSAKELPRHIEITVSDSGVGIPEEYLERIFEPFWQVNSAQRGPATGTGLGLSVVHRLVLLLGGEITVGSEVGEGTTFTLTLPRQRSPVGSRSQ